MTCLRTFALTKPLIFSIITMNLTVLAETLPLTSPFRRTCMNQVVAGIPVLPGDLWQPFIRTGAGDDFKYVIYPIIYEGKYVFSSGGPGYESCISVQVGPRGEIWSVQWAKPMVLLKDQQQLIQPEQACYPIKA